MLEQTYSRPQVNIPRQWPHENNFKINDSINLPDMNWWRQFQSPELNALIKKALRQNNNLALAITKIDYEQSQLQEIKLNWLPGMSLLSGYSQFPVLGNPGAFVIAAPVYVLNIFQQYQQQKSAQERVMASKHAKDCVRLMIIAQVSASFFTLIAQQEAIKLYANLLKHYRIQLTLAQSKYGYGLTSQDEIDLLKSQTKLIHSQLDILKHNVVVSKNRLHFLLNENPGDMVVKTSFKHIDTTRLTPGNLPMKVLNNRPDVREAEAQLRAANADIGVAGANLLPSITLGGYLGKGSSIKGPINLLESYVDLPIVNLPVLAQISASKARYRAARVNYINTVRKALRDVDNDLSAWFAYSSQMNSNTAAMRNEKQHCHWVALRYQHGIDNNSDLIQCKIKLDQFALTLNQNKLEQMMVMVKLYQDLAGGYHGD